MAAERFSESRSTAHIARSSQNIRTDLDTDAIARALIDNLHCLQGKLPQHATRNDWYMALAYTVRDRMAAPRHGARCRSPSRRCTAGHKPALLRRMPLPSTAAAAARFRGQCPNQSIAPKWT
jgi:hypothetical protein